LKFAVLEQCPGWFKAKTKAQRNWRLS